MYVHTCKSYRAISCNSNLLSIVGYLVTPDTYHKYIYIHHAQVAQIVVDRWTQRSYGTAEQQNDSLPINFHSSQQKK